MSEEVPVWRQAINDENHPLHRAAWILFSKDMNPKYAQDVLAGQKADVITFCNQILDTDELYNSENLGGGDAPIHAVELLCAWKIEACIPRLIRILEEEDWDTVIYGVTADAMAQLGTAIVDPLLKLAEDAPDRVEASAIAGTLADAAPNDERVIKYVRKIFDSQKDEFEINYMAKNVLASDPKGGAAWLQERLRTRKYSKWVKQRIERYIDDAEAGKS